MARELIYTDADALIAQHVGPHPSDRGLAEYWLHEPGVSVWTIIATLAVSSGDVDGVATIYAIPRAQVEAAQAFYARHRELIDDRIAQNRIE